MTNEETEDFFRAWRTDLENRDWVMFGSLYADNCTLESPACGHLIGRPAIVKAQREFGLLPRRHTGLRGPPDRGRSGRADHDSSGNRPVDFSGRLRLAGRSEYSPLTYLRCGIARLCTSGMCTM